MPQYALKDKETGEWYVGNRNFGGWGNKPRVFTKAGLASSLSSEVYMRWRKQWLLDNPAPPRPIQLYVQEDYIRWDGTPARRSVRTTDPVQLEMVAVQEAWFTKKKKDYAKYLKERGGVLNCLPENYELIEVSIGEE